MKMPTMNMSRTPDAKLTSLNSTGRISGSRADVTWTHKEQIKSEASEHSLDDDLSGGKPVLFLAAVQHQLQATDRNRQHAEAEPVEPQYFLTPARQKEHQAHR